MQTTKYALVSKVYGNYLEDRETRQPRLPLKFTREPFRKLKPSRRPYELVVEVSCVEVEDGYVVTMDFRKRVVT